MFEKNPELCLLAHLFDNVYKESPLPRPTTVNWERFENMVRTNKLALLAYTRVLEDNTLEIPAEWRTRFQELKKHQETELQRLGPSVEQAKRFLGDTPYVLVKTFRPFLYFTHDIDLLVADPGAIGEVVTAAGIEWDNIPRGSVQVEEPQWLDIEFYERVLPGSIQVIDDELALLNPTPTTLEGVSADVASPEIEIVTLLADAIFRLYELKLGDMIYIYTLAAKADWQLLIDQAEKHGWRRSFENIVGVLNGYHRELYGSPSPMEAYVPKVRSVPPVAPYVPGWFSTIRTLSGKGNRHLIKLPSYVSVLLKQNHPKIHSIYIRFIQVPLGRFVLRHLYR